MTARLAVFLGSLAGAGGALLLALAAPSLGSVLVLVGAIAFVVHLALIDRTVP